MKYIIISILAFGIFCTACNQQQDITGKVQAEVKDRAEAMVDSLKRVCDTNFDTALQSTVTAAIKANNKPATQAKPSIKASNKPKSTPAKSAATPPPPPKPISKGGRKGIGKGGGVLNNQNQSGIKTAPVRPGTIQTKPGSATQTKPQSTGTTTQPSRIKTRPGVKNKSGG